MARQNRALTSLPSKLWKGVTNGLAPTLRTAEQEKRDRGRITLERAPELHRYHMGLSTAEEGRGRDVQETHNQLDQIGWNVNSKSNYLAQGIQVRSGQVLPVGNEE